MLESWKYNSSVQNYQWERSTTAGKVPRIGPQTRQLGHTSLHNRKPKGTSGQKFSEMCWFLEWLGLKHCLIGHYRSIQ